MKEKAVSIGKIIREAREARGLSQSDLAASLDERLDGKIIQTTIGKIERGERSIGLDEAVQVADILNIDWRTFFDLLAPQSVEDELERITDVEFSAVLAVKQQAMKSFEVVEEFLNRFNDRHSSLEYESDKSIRVVIERLPEDLNILRGAYAHLQESLKLMEGILDFHSTASLAVSEGVDIEYLLEKIESGEDIDHIITRGGDIRVLNSGLRL
ncbi:helix-turn-helix transcriptional regulator [Corynebacterium sp. H128]|uniref:helix-turn-helix domain-containing protein n=1 Tax=Corynebacterium sp. H128 TaxID=3133427 RepID=UPI0030ADB488